MFQQDDYPNRPRRQNENRPAPELLSNLHRDLTASDCFEVEGTAPVAMCLAFGRNSSLTEVMVCIGPARIVGGARDGEVSPRNFRLHVEKLRTVFDSVDHCVWDPLDHESSGQWACLSIAGLYRGTPLWLRVSNVALGNVGATPHDATFDPA